MFHDESIQSLLDSGKHWKAKELLQGKVRILGYDLELFEDYGNILLAMHDKMEAGKYLFLSGSRKTEYDECINLYLSRYAGKGAQYIINTFPSSAKHTEYKNYPPAVAADLEKLKYKPKEIQKHLKNNKYKDTASQKVSSYGCAFIFIILGVLFLLGVVQGISALWQYFA